MATIKKLDNGKWFARIFWNDINDLDSNGKPKRKQKAKQGFKTKREAEKWARDTKVKFENGDIKVPIAEMRALAKGWQLKTFMNINQAILNEQNSELSQDNLKKYRKIVSKFDDKNLADMDGIIFDITHLYLIFLNSIQGKKKDKEAYNKIQKIIEHYLGIDNDDWMDDVPIHIHKERSNKENDNSNS